MKPREVPILFHWGIVTLLMLAFFWLVRTASWILIPLVVAFILYYLLAPLVDYLEGWGLQRFWAVTLVFILVGMAFVLVAPAFFEWASPKKIEEELGRYISGFQSVLLDFLRYLHERSGWVRRSGILYSAETGLEQFFNKDLPALLPEVALNMAMVLPFVVLIPYLAFYFLLDGRRFKKLVIRSLPNRFFEQSLLLIHRVDEQIARFLRGLFMESLIIGTLASVGLYLMGIEKFLLIGVLTGILNVVPYVGPLISALSAVIIAVTDPREPSLLVTVGGIPEQYVPVCVVMLYVLIRILDDVMIIPLVMGKSLRMHPVIVVLAIFCGGELGGFWGILMALPVLGVVHVFCQMLFQMVLNRRQALGTLAALPFWERGSSVPDGIEPGGKADAS